MKNRLEYKYLLSLNVIDRLRNDLLRYMEYDEYASRKSHKGYTVRSIYLDSYDFKCYYEKLDGILVRNKFRVRGYDTKEENKNIFLEIKRKHDGFISKDRFPVPVEEFQKNWSMEDYKGYEHSEDKEAFTNFSYYYHLRNLDPKVLVIYDREPFQCKFGSSLRITFDKALRSKPVSSFESLFDNEYLTESLTNKFIFEVKFFQVLPQWINSVLNKYDLTRISVSKYTTSIDAHPISSIRLKETIQSI
jgi:hypothetical protein